MERSGVAIVIPAFNEGSTITDVIATVRLHGNPVVVSDGSTDATARLAREAGAIVVELPENNGYDGALKAGFDEVIRRAVRYVVTFDADGQHDGAVLPLFLAELDRGAQVVVGIRPRFARRSEAIFAAYTSRRYGVADPLCGMKAYEMDAFVASGAAVEARRSLGTAPMLQMVRHGCSVGQVEIPVYDRQDGSRIGGRFRSNIRIVGALAMTIWRDLTSGTRAP